jgi:hypothetical protein
MRDTVIKFLTTPRELTPAQLAVIAASITPVDISGKVDKESGKALLASTEAAKIHAPTLDHTNILDHSHSNKSTLDAYTQTEVNLADAVTKRHSNTLDHNGTTQDTAIAGKNPIRLFANLAAPVASSGTTEKVLLQLLIPAVRAVVGSTFRAWVVGNSSSTGTLIFRIRCGANGTISDTEDWKSVTSVAQVANARAGFEVLITIRSATTIAVDGVGYAGAVQLPTTIAAPATPAIVISGNWYINMTVVCSSGTFTAQVGSVEEIR